MNFHDGIIKQIIRIARLAGLEIMKIYTGYNNLRIDVNKKLDQSPVTNADLVAHQVIVYELHQLTPNVPIISEEHVPKLDQCKNWDHFWLIDPLDGTKEFLSRNGEFTVNIAFIKYGEPIIGVVYAPAYNVLYASFCNQVWKINANGEQFKIATYTSQSPVIVMSRSHSLYNQQQLYDYLITLKDYKIINIGSSLKFCLIAEGVAQLYPRFSSTKIWDTAAGHAIAKAAGAFVFDWNGYPLDYKNINENFSNSGFQVFLC